MNVWSLPQSFDHHIWGIIAKNKCVSMKIFCIHVVKRSAGGSMLVLGPKNPELVDLFWIGFFVSVVKRPQHDDNCNQEWTSANKVLQIKWIDLVRRTSYHKDLSIWAVLDGREVNIDATLEFQPDDDDDDDSRHDTSLRTSCPLPSIVVKTQAVKQRVKVLSTSNRGRKTTWERRCDFDKRGLFLHEVNSNLKMKM